MTIKGAPRSRDQQIKLVKEALEVPMTDELRAKLEARLSELQSEGPPDAVPMEKAPSESHLPSAGRHIPKDRDTKIRMIQGTAEKPSLPRHAEQADPASRRVAGRSAS